MKLHPISGAVPSRSVILAPAVLAMAFFGTACGTAEAPPPVSSKPPSSTSAPLDGYDSTRADAKPVTTPTNTEAGPQATNSSLAGTGAVPDAGAAPNGTVEMGDAGAPIGSNPPATEVSEPATGVANDAGAPSPSDPNTDENLVFIKQDGFQTTYFAVHCASIGEDGSAIDGDTNSALPVGPAHILQCELDRFPSRAAIDVLSASNEFWCALGELGVYESGGDERVEVLIASPPDVVPATLIGTHEGDEITVSPASAFGGSLWPIWVLASYEVVDLARAVQGQTCDQVFGL